jgi:NTE family protein
MHPAAESSPLAAGLTSADFGVDRRVQELLSRIRTDLDSFTEVEATSLMLDGYLMSDSILRDTPGLADLVRPEGTGPVGRWEFRRIGPWLAAPTAEFLRQLRVGSYTLFKVLRLGLLGPLTAALLTVGVLGLLWGLWHIGISRWWLALGILVVAVSGLPVWLYLQIFNRLYLRRGRIERLRPPPQNVRA